MVLGITKSFKLVSHEEDLFAVLWNIKKVVGGAEPFQNCRIESMISYDNCFWLLQNFKQEKKGITILIFNIPNHGKE